MLEKLIKISKEAYAISYQGVHCRCFVKDINGKTISVIPTTLVEKLLAKGGE